MISEDASARKMQTHTDLHCMLSSDDLRKKCLTRAWACQSVCSSACYSRQQLAFMCQAYDKPLVLYVVQSLSVVDKDERCISIPRSAHICMYVKDHQDFSKDFSTRGI